MTIRLPAKLAAQFKANAQQANTSPTDVLRQAASEYVRGDKVSRTAMQRQTEWADVDFVFPD